jgi:hypothetical protein
MAGCAFGLTHPTKWRLLRILPRALAESEGFGAPHPDHHNGAGGDADEGEHDSEGDFHGVCIDDLHADWCPVSIRIRRFNWRGGRDYFRVGLGGCRSTTTESGCETMVMNQIELTTSDQNVFQ